MNDKPEMKLVPVEPTDEMLDDAYAEDEIYSHVASPDDIYKAMTKDAPTVQEVDLDSKYKPRIDPVLYGLASCKFNQGYNQALAVFLF